MNIGRLGVWSRDLTRVDDSAVPAGLAEAESFGYGAAWFPPGAASRGFDVARVLLPATQRIAVATSITSIWATSAGDTNAAFAELEALAPGRFLLGVGVSHRPLVDQRYPGRYERPVQSTRRYLEALRVPRERRVLAALSPRMLDIARELTLGTHPYLVTPAMTAWTRAYLGAGTFLAVEQAVILETNRERARALAREHLSIYFPLPNYVNNWLRSGYTTSDIADGGSDRLVDDLVAWGDPAAVATRIREHFATGADHVCIQVIGGDEPLPLAQWRAIATEVLERN